MVGKRRVRPGHIVALAVVIPAVGFGWPIALGDTAASRLVTDRHGNILAAIAGNLTSSAGTVDIIRLEHGTGRVQWRRPLGQRRGVDTEIGDLRVTAAGDALFTGVIDDANGTKFLVTRLDGRTGKRLWGTTLEGSEPGGGGNVGRALAADRKGDVVAAGSLLNAPYTEGDFAVVKLDGASGAERWRFSFAGPPAVVPGAAARAVVVDAAGAAIAAGTIVTRGAD